MTPPLPLKGGLVMEQKNETITRWSPEEREFFWDDLYAKEKAFFSNSTPERIAARSAPWLIETCIY